MVRKKTREQPEANRFSGYIGRSNVFGTAVKTATSAGSRTARNRGKRKQD